MVNTIKLSKKLLGIIIFLCLLALIIAGYSFQRDIYILFNPGDSKFQSHVHSLVVKDFNSSHEHIAILDETNKDNIEIIAIKGSQYNEKTPSPLQINKFSLGLIDKKIDENRVISINQNLQSTDILVTEDKRIFFSYLIHDDDRKYIALAVDELIQVKDAYSTKSIYQSELIPSKRVLHTLSGGKMIQYNKNEILLTFGSLGHEKSIKDNKNYAVGKIYKINFNTKQSEVFSSGHRNPQGLTYSKTYKMILETEHGPKGGDEVNQIIYGEDYGWPHVSYGMGHPQTLKNYVRYVSDNSFKAIWASLMRKLKKEKYEQVNVYPGNHNIYKKPIFAFIPSIGIKAIEQLPKDQTEFPNWKDNFLVCSAKSLYRLEITKEKSPRVIFTEKLPLPFGCRDIQILSDGKFIVNSMKIISRNKKYSN